jgi:hypothetical protein
MVRIHARQPFDAPEACSWQAIRHPTQTELDLLRKPARRMAASHALSKPKARRMGWLLTDAPEACSGQAIRHPTQTALDLLPKPARRMDASHALNSLQNRRREAR